MDGMDVNAVLGRVLYAAERTVGVEVALAACRRGERWWAGVRVREYMATTQRAPSRGRDIGSARRPTMCSCELCQAVPGTARAAAGQVEPLQAGRPELGQQRPGGWRGRPDAESVCGRSRPTWP
jgi:hypothetical protein